MEELEKVFQVSEFNEFIDIYLKKVDEVVIEGEISELNISQGKWVYMTLKDEKAAVELFATVYQLTNAKHLEIGMKVHAYGIPGLYQKNGRFKLQTHRIVPVGEGALQAMFDKLRAQLEQEGLFSQARKRTITDLPENIGLITAKGSQAYKDFIKVITERRGGIKINFYPVNVQGKDSVPSIVRAFEYFNKNLPDLDAIVLIRGGGSLEDLISFNDEAVVRAIFSSNSPVICGVGHEGDVSLADLVADLRASTPSNAAELLTRERNECLREINNLIFTMESNIKHQISEGEKQISHAFNVIDHEIKDRVNQTSSLINRFANEFRFYEQELVRSQERINSMIKQNLLYIQKALDAEDKKLKFLTRTLRNMDYRRLLEKGYSITTNLEGKVIKSIEEVNKNSDIETVLSDGKIVSVVKNS